MNNTVKDAIIFISGAAVGAVGMYFGVKKYYEDISNREIEEVRCVYEDKIAEVEAHKSSIDGEIVGPKEIDVKVRTAELNNKPDIKDYTKYFNAKGTVVSGVGKELVREQMEIINELNSEGVDEAELETPPDDEPYTDEEDEEQSLDVIDYELNGASRKAIEEDLPPHVIEPSDFELTCTNYDKQSLIYHIYDNLVTNDEGELLEVASLTRLIGDIISESGFDENSDDMLYVRNDKILTDFEITKVYTAFGE